MRREIAGASGFDPNASPFERFREFARLIIAVPKTEVENRTNESEPKTLRGNLKKVKKNDSGNSGSH
jgi:hypothetical protein